MKAVASGLLVIVGCLFVYVLTLGSTEGGYTRQKPVTYKFYPATDWAEDSTVSESKREYCEYVYTKEIEEWKRNKQQ
jgi:hypothetical protein